MAFFAHYRKSDGAVFMGESWDVKGTLGPTPDIFPSADALLETDILLDPALHYIKNGKYKEKEELNTQHTIKGLRVSFPRIPAGTIFYVRSAEYTHEEGPLVIEVDKPQTLEILFLAGVTHKGADVEVVFD